jgi:hypothetical protein
MSLECCVVLCGGAIYIEQFEMFDAPRQQRLRRHRSHKRVLEQRQLCGQIGDSHRRQPNLETSLDHTYTQARNCRH